MKRPLYYLWQSEEECSKELKEKIDSLHRMGARVVIYKEEKKDGRKEE